MKDLQVMFAIAESAVVCRSAAILLATKSGHEVPPASAVNAMTYAFIPAIRLQSNYSLLQLPILIIPLHDVTCLNLGKISIYL